MKLLLIPPGEFTMGTAGPDGASLNDETLHEVRLTQPFFIGSTEITVAQFRAFVAAKGGFKTDIELLNKGGWGWDNSKREFEFRRGFNWRNPGFPQTDNHPAISISWGDAVLFCKWLTEKEGVKYRLPTEAEWEFGCRAGTDTPFSFGATKGNQTKSANFHDASLQKKEGKDVSRHEDDGFAFTSPVGSFNPNSFGLFDMHGNASEFSSDGYGPLDSKPKVDPRVEMRGRYCVSRGGGFLDYPHNGRSGSRDRCVTRGALVYFGFRVVKEP